MTALRILVGLARAARRQIGHTVLGGCNRRPLEKITANLRNFELILVPIDQKLAELTDRDKGFSEK